MRPATKRDERLLRAEMDEIVRLKAELAQVKEQLQAVETRKAELEAKLERQQARVEKLVDDPERKYPALGDKSIIDRIADLFVENPTTIFGPNEVMKYLGIPIGHIDAVRTSLKRLVTRRVLLKGDYGEYWLNPTHEES